MSVLDGPGEGTWSVFAMKVVEERDEAKEEHDALRREIDEARAQIARLRSERRQLRRRLVECRRWVGVCPLDAAKISEMSLVRDLADDTLKEVVEWDDGWRRAR